MPGVFDNRVAVVTTHTCTREILRRSPVMSNPVAPSILILIVGGSPDHVNQNGQTGTPGAGQAVQGLREAPGRAGRDSVRTTLDIMHLKCTISTKEVAMKQ